MKTPAHLHGFNCDDYFSSEWSETGCWDEPSQLMVVLPAREIRLDRELDLLVIGRAGVDGLVFGYRRGHSGLWTYYAIDDRFVRLAASTAELVDGYLSGRITV